MLDVVLILLDDQGEIESIRHLTPLWVFPRTYVLTKFAESQMDPANQVAKLNSIKSPRGSGRHLKSPPGLPAPTTFKRYVAASPSGNVNSVIIQNYFQKAILPELRAAGVPRTDTVCISSGVVLDGITLPFSRCFL